MNISEKNAEFLNKKGIYKIYNIETGKSYIGSTRVSFLNRYRSHKSMLLNNKHDNQYLQNVWNKDNNLLFEILEVISNKKEIYNREQYYIDNIGFNNLYNLNPIASKTPKISKEIIKKRNESIKKYWRENGTEKLKGKIPWNKNIKYKSTDHLKVPKLKKGNRSKDIKTKRELLPEIEVFNLDMKSLGVFRSARDLEEYTYNNPNKIPVNSFKKESFRGTPKYVLKTYNISKSTKTGKPYKGLYFKIFTQPF